jgi:hypothetical protein
MESMDMILSVLNQPIVLTLVSLLVGGFLLNLITERRARENRLREKRIEFISDVAQHVNSFLPNLYEPLRTGNLGMNQEIAASLKEIMATRMTVQIGSKAYLRSEDFSQKYNVILDELLFFIHIFIQASSAGSQEGLVSRIEERRGQFAKNWPLEETLSATDGQLNENLIVWLDMIAHRATDLLSSSLEKSIR